MIFTLFNKLYLFNLAIWTNSWKVVVHRKENKVPKESTDDENIPKTAYSHMLYSSPHRWLNNDELKRIETEFQ